MFPLPATTCYAQAEVSSVYLATSWECGRGATSICICSLSIACCFSSLADYEPVFPTCFYMELYCSHFGTWALYRQGRQGMCPFPGMATWSWTQARLQFSLGKPWFIWLSLTARVYKVWRDWGMKRLCSWQVSLRHVQLTLWRWKVDLYNFVLQQMSSCSYTQHVVFARQAF